MIPKRIEIKLKYLFAGHFFGRYVKFPLGYFYHTCYICSTKNNLVGIMCKECHKVYQPILDEMIAKENRKREMLAKMREK
jgi:hypothetical protein